MYLTRIALDTRRRETMRALASPGVLHGAVEGAFALEHERVLWRTDMLGETTYLLILSPTVPDSAHIVEQFGFAGTAAETKAYDALLSRIEPGQRLRFRLRANPVRSASKGKAGGRGEVHAHVTQEQQKKWLIDRAERNGFALSEDELDVTDTRWHKFKKHANEKQEVTLRTAAFEGVLTVTDAELFREALVSGIGRAKAYGCGLITVIRV